MDSSKRGENRQNPADGRHDNDQSPPDDQAALQGQPTSSLSVNSDVPHGQFAQTLSTLNENMANMADIMNQIWQRVDSGGKAARATKRHQEDQDTDSSSASTESEQDEYTAKRRRPNHQEGDTISVVASEDDVKQLLKDMGSSNLQQNNESPTDDSLLLELEAQFNEDKSLGPAVGERLAAIAANRWTEKLSPEKLKEIYEKYKQPLNCEAVRVSRINPEIWSQISQHKKKTDLRLTRIQQNVQKAVFATLQMAEVLTAKNGPPTSTDAKNDREALVRIAVNLVAMLGHMNADVMSMRQEAIKPALKPEFQKICHATVPPNSKFLFGDDLAKLVRDSKETNSIANTLTLTKACHTGATNTSRRNVHAYNRDGKSYTDDNRSRNTTTNSFLWRGQKPYRKRPKLRDNVSQNQQRK